jgi:hypothetical protein
LSTVRWAWVLALGLALALLPVSGNAEDRMSGEEIAKVFAGVTLDGVYFDGSFFTEQYRSDGSIVYHDADNADKGEWSVKDDTFCTFYKDREGACFFVLREGKNCFAFYEQKIGSGGVPVPREEWTSEGWIQSAPSTCTVTKDETI